MAKYNTDMAHFIVNEFCTTRFLLVPALKILRILHFFTYCSIVIAIYRVPRLSVRHLKV